jgi:hypothetical protein
MGTQPLLPTVSATEADRGRRRGISGVFAVSAGFN